MNGGTELERAMDATFINVIRNIPTGIPGEYTEKKDNVKIRKISIRNMIPLAKAWGKYDQEAALYLDCPPDQVANLSDESFERVIDEGRRINFTSFAKWYQWQQETLRAVGQGNLIEGEIREVTNAILTDAKRQSESGR